MQLAPERFTSMKLVVGQPPEIAPLSSQIAVRCQLVKKAGRY